MTNTDLLAFKAKYSLKYMNGNYMLSGFDHINSIVIVEDDLDDILSLCPKMNQEEWEEYIIDYNSELAGAYL